MRPLSGVHQKSNLLLKSTHSLRDATAKYSVRLCKKTTFRISIFYFLIQTDEMNKKTRDISPFLVRIVQGNSEHLRFAHFTYDQLTASLRLLYMTIFVLSNRSLWDHALVNEIFFPGILKTISAYAIMPLGKKDISIHSDAKRKPQGVVIPGVFFSFYVVEHLQASYRLFVTI